jgi:23S rRNA (adenine2503-C2)-methyltransferase
MVNLYDLKLEELTALLQSWGEKPFRARQVWEWLYKHKAPDFESMRNLPAGLRARLAAETRLGVLDHVVEQHSTDGATIKHLYRLDDEQLIESVLMEYTERHTACISTQAGCAMGCVFCATGQMGFARHLTAGEIVEQAVWFARQLETTGDRLSNVVLMGMGEPLHNYEATLQAVDVMTSPDGLGIGQRHITISTVGLVPAMRRLADEGRQVGLAVSLHAATDEERSVLLPINKKYPLAELIDACRYYIDQTGRRITFEWALISGQTDTEKQAHALGSLIRGLKCHVNAIPLNPTGGYAGRPSDPQQVERWQKILEGYGVSSTIRVRRGIDIQAGCGQLKSDVVRRQRKTEQPIL